MSSTFDHKIKAEVKIVPRDLQRIGRSVRSTTASVIQIPTTPLTTHPPIILNKS